MKMKSSSWKGHRKYELFFLLSFIQKTKQKKTQQKIITFYFIGHLIESRIIADMLFICCFCFHCLSLLFVS